MLRAAIAVGEMPSGKESRTRALLITFDCQYINGPEHLGGVLEGLSVYWRPGNWLASGYGTVPIG